MPSTRKKKHKRMQKKNQSDTEEEDYKIVFKIQGKPTRIRWSLRSDFRRRPVNRARRRPVAAAAFARASSVPFVQRRRRRPFPIRAFAMSSSSSEVRLCCRRSNRRWPRDVARKVCRAGTICTCDSRNTVQWRASVVLRDSFVLCT